MKNKLVRSSLILSLFLLGGCGNQEADADKLASTNNNAVHSEADEISEDSPRIVAGTAVLADIAAALDVPLVGVTSHKSDELPEMYQNLPQVGSGPNLDYEMLASTEPDVYVTSETFEPMTRGALEGINIEPVYFSYSKYEEVFDTILNMGQYVDKEDEAQNIVEEMKNEEEKVLAEAENLQNKKIFILIGSSEGMSASSNELYVGSLTEKLGMENIASDVIGEGTGMAVYNVEAVINENPDYIITYSLNSDFNMNENDESDNQDQIEKEFNQPIWQETTAAQENQIFHITSDDIPINGGLDNVENLEKVRNLLQTGEIQNDNE